MCEKSGYKSQRGAKWAKKSTSFTLNLSPNFCQLYAPSFGIISTRGETSKVLFLVKKSSVLIRFSDNFYAENAILRTFPSLESRFSQKNDKKAYFKKDEKWIYSSVHVLEIDFPLRIKEQVFFSIPRSLFDKLTDFTNSLHFRGVLVRVSYIDLIVFWFCSSTFMISSLFSDSFLIILQNFLGTVNWRGRGGPIELVSKNRLWAQFDSY